MYATIIWARSAWKRNSDIGVAHFHRKIPKRGSIFKNYGNSILAVRVQRAARSNHPRTQSTARAFFSTEQWPEHSYVILENLSILQRHPPWVLPSVPRVARLLPPLNGRLEPNFLLLYIFEWAVWAWDVAAKLIKFSKITYRSSSHHLNKKKAP
jgi:hypothetical protein